MVRVRGRVLAGFEKVPLLGGQNVPLGFGRTGSAELVRRCNPLGLIDGPGPEQGAAPQRGEK